MVGCHHRLGGHEFDQAPGDGDGQGSLVCYSSWGCKELDTTVRLINFTSKKGARARAHTHTQNLFIISYTVPGTIL